MRRDDDDNDDDNDDDDDALTAIDGARMLQPRVQQLRLLSARTIALTVLTI
jgi:hypothetical protein